MAKKNRKNFSKRVILWEGWIRFISIIDKETSLNPDKFFINPQYSNQRVLEKNLKKKDKKDFINIRNKFEFFASMNFLNKAGKTCEFFKS